ncbi:MAG TPA: ATP-binding protein [Candidatus Paceibacterota bacterium]|nr:ATP-binding protein [Candidatus Paceibacterota bacterium]
MNRAFEEEIRKHLGDTPIPPGLAALFEAVSAVYDKEDELRDEEERAMSIVENARDTIIAADLTGLITYVNRNAEEYGFKRDEVVGKRLLDFIPGEYHPGIIADLALLALGKTAAGVIEVNTPKGRLFMEYRSSSIHAGGKVVGLQTLLHDITDRRQVENELAKEKERVEERVSERTRELEYERAKLAEIAGHMTMGAILLDRDGAVGFVNDFARNLLRLDDRNRAVEVLAAVFGNVPVRDNLAKALKGESTRVKQAEAEGLVFSLSFEPLARDSDVFGAIVWIFDITGQTILERSKNQFVAIASHEMRTPLALIRGNAELMLEAPAVKDNAELRTEDESIVKSAVRLLEIVNDFLDIENLEQGKIVLKTEPVDIVKTLADTVHELAPLAAKKGIAMIFDEGRAPELPKIPLDRYRLQQIYTNLVSNAIHYTDQGTITVTVKHDGGVASVFVADTGIGIMPDDQKRLFNKFETGATFVRSKEFGSGMGLYISRILARLMGGDLTLDHSDFGSGSTFRFSMPLEPKPGQAAAV